MNLLSCRRYEPAFHVRLILCVIHEEVCVFYKHKDTLMFWLQGF